MIEKYEKYLIKVSGYIDKFFEQQKPYIFCKEGCSLCCENGEYPLSKVEFEYAMLGYQSLDEEQKKIIDANVKEIKKNKKIANKKEKFLYVCPFLINKKCSIYSHRGLICRSYGLMFFMWDKEGKQVYKRPFCAEVGLNYSNVIDEETGTISSEKWKATGIETEPLSYNVGLDFLIDNDMTKEIGLDVGEQRAIIDWFEE